MKEKMIDSINKGKSIKGSRNLCIYLRCEILKSLFKDRNEPSNIKDMGEIKANFGAGILGR